MTSRPDIALSRPRGSRRGIGRGLVATAVLVLLATVPAGAANDAYRPPNGDSGSSLGTLYEPQGGGQGGGYAQQGGGYGATPGAGDVYYPPRSGGPTGAPRDDSYRPPASGGYGGAAGSPDYPPPRDYSSPPAGGGGYPGANSDGYGSGGSAGYGEPYHPPREAGNERYDGGGRYQRPDDGAQRPSSYSKNEIVDAGHHFFGSVSQGLANIIEYAFQEAGRPNGYVLGEDAGGAFVAGLRYGEGTLFTKDAGNHKVFWQGPSLGYDFGAEGSKTMVLVYNLRDPSEIYNRFGGIQGSAYVVGGVSIQFQKYGDVVLAPIRSGLGLRLGANVGYLKYTRSPTWNPF